MALSLRDDQFVGYAGLFQAFDEQPGLLDGHEFIPVSVKQKHGRIAGIDVGDGRILAENLQPQFRIDDPLDRFVSLSHRWKSKAASIR